MSKESIVVSAVIPATPHEVYEAWLDSHAHSAMTGGAANIDRSIGGRHTAWDGYIEGRVLELDPSRRIVQSWRTSEFPADSEDSRVEILLEAEDGNTRITIEHSFIPFGQGAGYQSGWHEHYFRPMARYFEELVEPEGTPDLHAQIDALHEDAEGDHDHEVVARTKTGPPRAKTHRAAKKPAKKEVAKVAKKPAKKTAKKAVKKATKKPAKKAAKKPAKRAAKPAKKSAKKPSRPVAKAAKKKPAARGKKPSKKAAKPKAKPKR